MSEQNNKPQQPEIPKETDSQRIKREMPELVKIADGTEWEAWGSSNVGKHFSIVASRLEERLPKEARMI